MSTVDKLFNCSEVSLSLNLTNKCLMRLSRNEKSAAPAGPALSHTTHTHTHIQSVPDALREIAQRLEFSVVLNLDLDLDFF